MNTLAVDRHLLTKADKPLKKEPPLLCSRDKTIVFDGLKRSLFFFRDSRTAAQTYAKEVLPTLISSPWKPEDILKLYADLDHQYLEFDFQTNLLFLCSIKKTQT